MPGFPPRSSSNCAGRMLLAVVLPMLLLAGGCPPAPTPPPKDRYFGPTLSVEQLVEKINANNQKVPSIFSQIRDFEILQVDQDEKHHNYSGNDGRLLYLKPHGLLLRGDTIAGEGFEIGTTAERYWLKINSLDTLWTGTYAHISPEAMRQLPINPALVLEVLGVSDINTDLLDVPAPVMRFDNDQDAYVLVWIVPLPDHWGAQKEIWYDRKTLLPRQVRLYDVNDGRMVVKAELFDYQPLPPTQEVKADVQSPKIATRYELYFPKTRTSLNLTLFGPSVTNKGTIPNEKTFKTLVNNLANPGVKKIINLDQGTSDQN